MVAHFQIINIIQKGGGKEDNFAEFWDKHWFEDILGKKPHQDWRELTQRDVRGEPIVRKHYVDYYGLCLNSPYTRQLLQRMLDVALDTGVDGIMSNYNYRWGCLCVHCQAEFKKYLSERYTPALLKATSQAMPRNSTQSNTSGRTGSSTLCPMSVRRTTGVWTRQPAER